MYLKITGGPFYLDETGRFADMIPDDQALWINTPQGLSLSWAVVIPELKQYG